jgi:alpha-tubulin suppressor-like RCC1 family protein
MSNEFLSPEGDLENHFVTDYWLIDQYVGDQLWVWGSPSYGALGNGLTTSLGGSTPVTTFAGGNNWKQVTAGNGNITGIKTDGTLWIWGKATINGNAQITIRSTPVTTFAGGNDWKQVSLGTNYAAAIKTDGTLWTWGSNATGQLGNASTTIVTTPVTTFAGGTDWKQVTCGNGNTAAIKTDGTLWTWGYNFGQLGDASTFPNKSTPVTTFAGGTNWRQVSSGRGFNAAIKTDGTLWTWGNGSFGQLGNANTTNRSSTPVTTFAGGNNWKQVSAGFTHMAAIKTDGTLWTWGNNFNGQLGNGLTTSLGVGQSTPVTTFAGGNDWKQASAGFTHMVAIKTDGTLWTWGNGNSGRLGHSSTFNTSTPITTFAGGTNWKQVSGGNFNTAAVQSGINAEYPLS